LALLLGVVETLDPLTVVSVPPLTLLGFEGATLPPVAVPLAPVVAWVPLIVLVELAPAAGAVPTPFRLFGLPGAMGRVFPFNEPVAPAGGPPGFAPVPAGITAVDEPVLTPAVDPLVPVVPAAAPAPVEPPAAAPAAQAGEMARARIAVRIPALTMFFFIIFWVGYQKCITRAGTSAAYLLAEEEPRAPPGRILR
jgi:hypothetical protein